MTEEMIRLELPIVAFDLGAPGERLRGYRNARLCAEVSARVGARDAARFPRAARGAGSVGGVT